MPDGPYPDDWDHISEYIRDRAGWQCECTGQCGLHRGDRCTERGGEEAKYASGRVALTVAHLNHYPPDCRDGNLLAMCQTCHLRYDQVLHATHAWRTRRAGKAAGDLFEWERPDAKR